MFGPTIDLFLQQTYARSIYILKQPVTNEEVIWILAPLIVTLILMEVYFGRYRKEELGWNTAFGNSLILIFVSANLLRFIVINDLWTDPIRSGTIIVLLLVGFILTFIDFFHTLPEDWAFTMSSKFPISFIAFLAILFIYGNIPLDKITLSAFVLIFIAAYLIMTIIHYLTPAFRGLMPQEVPEPTKEKEI